MNCIFASRARQQSLAAEPTLTPLLSSLLRRIHSLEASAESSAASGGEAAGAVIDDYHAEANLEQFGVTYAILKRLFSQGFFGKAFLALQSVHHGAERAETINTEQVTLLKFFDSYLHHGAEGYSQDAQATDPSPSSDVAVMLTAFVRLAATAETIMAVDDGEPWEGARAELVAIHPGLVLLMQSILSFVLPAQGRSSTDGCGAEVLKEDDDEDTLVEWENTSVQHAVGRQLVEELCDPTSKTIEQIVALLATTARFSPAISPFQPTSSTAAQPPEGHLASQTGRAAPQGADGISSSPAGKGLPYLKRDLLRLITALTFAPPDPGATNAQEKQMVRSVQDRVRESGGLFHVLNMTVLDVENPCESPYLPSLCALVRC